MKENKNMISWRITLAITLIFGLGFTLGKVTSIDRLAKIEGYKINLEQDSLAIYVPDRDAATGSNATSGNVNPDEDYATAPNATSGNVGDDCDEDYATAPNATSGNVDPDEGYATAPNATSGNVQPEDDEPVITDPVRVELDGKEKIELKNEEITADHIKYIRTSTKDVIVDATNNTKISKELLSAISASSKNTLVVNAGGNQFVFYGSKIETVTDVDVYMNINTVAKDEDVSKTVSSKGIVLKFLDGNRFPEGTIVRVKETDAVKSEITTDAKVYNYNTKDGSLKLVQTNIGKEDGYYNLKISGEGKFVLVNKDVEIAEGTKTEEKKEVVEFVDSNMTYLLVIAGSVVVIFVVTAMLVASRGKREVKVEVPVEPVPENKPIETQETTEEVKDVIEEKQEEQQNK